MPRCNLILLILQQTKLTSELLSALTNDGLAGADFLLSENEGGKNMYATCPECDASIQLTKPIKGEIITCPDCGAELELVSENPLKLALAPKEEEDWGE